MLKIKQNTGFTIVELMVVIIIVGVLASLALPKYFKIVNCGYKVEAVNQISALRKGVESCFYSTNNYSKCTDPTKLMVDNMDKINNGKFYYIITSLNKDSFEIHAIFKKNNNEENEVIFIQDKNNIKITGEGIFKNL